MEEQGWCQKRRRIVRPRQGRTGQGAVFRGLRPRLFMFSHFVAAEDVELTGYYIIGLWSRLLGEVVNDDFFAEGFEDLLHKFDVGGMRLVIVLRFFVGEDEVERDLVRLVHDGSMAGDHPADVELEHAGDVAQILFRAGGQCVSGAGLSGIGPEDDDV